MYVIKVAVDYCWVPDGTGGAMLGQNQSNNPGYGAALGPGQVPAGQSLQLRVSEVVPGANAPTSGNFNTALTAAVTDLVTLQNTAGAYSGGTQTPLAIAQGWATGNP